MQPVIFESRITIVSKIQSPKTLLEHLCARLPDASFKISSFIAVVGVSLGVYMGLSTDHSLAPVHVHLNLIGWVSVFLFGLFYRMHPSAIGKAAIAQVAMSVIGSVTMLSGLAGLLLTGDAFYMPFAVVGSLLVWAGFLVFFIIVAKVR